MKISFSESDRERIREAVRQAERETSGEIVPYVIARCSDYEAAIWRGAAAASLVVLAGTLAFLQIYDGWGLVWLHSPWGPSVTMVLGGLIGAALVAGIPSLRRLLAGPERLTRVVHDRAMRAFVEEEMFKTRDRTGILLFISMFEHRIEVVGDEGINRAVTPDDWVDVVETIQRGIRSGAIAQGIVEAVGKCGSLLREHGLDIQPDDTDELSNRLRIQSDD